MHVTQYHPGTFSWIELATSDRVAATHFYAALFGWTTHEIPLGNDDVYVMLQKAGKDVAALYEQKNQPPAWLSYVTVASVDESLEAAKRLGGSVAAGPMDVMEVGRMAIIHDPQGAALALWQAKQHIGAELVGEANTLSWNELATTDRDGAVRFYSQLFGWRAEETTTAVMHYVIVWNGERQAGGIYTMPDEMRAHMPPNWMPYIRVDDCDAAAAQARELGAVVPVGPTDIPNVGRFAMIRDPQGAFFAVITLAE